MIWGDIEFFWGNERWRMKIFDYIEKKLESEETRKTVVEIIAVLTASSLALAGCSRVMNNVVRKLEDLGMDGEESASETYRNDYIMNHLLGVFVEGFDNDEIIVGEFDEEILPLDRPFTITYDDEGRKMIDGEYVVTKATPTMIFVDYYNDDSGERKVRKQVLKIDDEHYQNILHELEVFGCDENIRYLNQNGIKYTINDSILDDKKYKPLGDAINEAVRKARFLEYQNTDEYMCR